MNHQRSHNDEIIFTFQSTALFRLPLEAGTLTMRRDKIDRWKEANREMVGFMNQKENTLKDYQKRLTNLSCFVVETRRRPGDELKVSPSKATSCKRFANIL